MKQEKKAGIITKVSGPLVVAKNMADVQMYDVVRVSDKLLFGEVIELRGDRASIQVYEETAGVGPGEPVYFTGEALSVELGPGLIESIFDGIQRPLDLIYKNAGDRIPLGIDVPRLDREKQWDFQPVAKTGNRVVPGDIIGTVQETPVVLHKIMVPHDVTGTLEWIHSGLAKITDVIARVKDDAGREREITMLQRWPVRRGRPYQQKIAPREPMVTGQRVIDTFFPIAIGGIAAIPGPFGSGKTVVQHQLAKWADADIIVYVGCGERGNEMTDVLNEFPRLHDPKTGEFLIKRTVLIANTSNMPVAAREASIYTGITIAEYYRDMGYNVAIMADSTSRWAEALRELSGRMEEMPADEGFPAYLPTRLAEFYERAGLVTTLGGHEGSITTIGAVSPPGGDFSEPVTQHTKRFVRAFWALDKQLANARHYPAISWLESYSEYIDDVAPWWDEKTNESWRELRSDIMAIMQKEARLEHVVKLVGADVLPDSQRLILEVAAMFKNAFLQQNAFDKVDAFCVAEKQYVMLNIIVTFYTLAAEAIQKGVTLASLKRMDVVRDIMQMKYECPNDELNRLDTLLKELEESIHELTSIYG